jgi:uncharacterized protein (DUF58 family)
MSSDNPRKYIDPHVLNKITHLELKARAIVEGFLSGMHKSPHHGFSVEFKAHREYVAGDDLKHLDWKVFGRSDRLFIKEYEMETNLRGQIVLDTSESMDYGSGELTKLELACYVAASMAYLLNKQQDAVGITCFDKGISTRLPTKTGHGHMSTVLQLLAGAKAKDRTDVEHVFRGLADKFGRRGMVIIVSDLFDDPEKVLRGLQYFRSKAHDVVLFHIWDEYELTFPFKRMTKFEGLEIDEKVLCDPTSIRKAYLEEVEAFSQRIRRGCQRQMVDYTLLSTDRRLDVELTKFLAARMGTRLVRRGTA